MATHRTLFTRRAARRHARGFATLVAVLTVPAVAGTFDRLGHGKPLQGHLTVTISGQRTWPDESNPAVQHSITVSRTARHEVLFADSNSSPDPRVIVIRGSEQKINATVRDVDDGVLTAGRRDLTCPLPDTDPLSPFCVHGAVSIAIEPAAKRYFFTFNTIPVTSVVTRDGERDETRDIEVTGFRVGPIPLPDRGPLTGSKTYPIRSRPMRPGPRERNRDGPAAHGSYEIGSDPDDPVQLQATIVWNFDEPSEAEATVTIDGYEEWIPEGNLADPTKPGNSLTVSVKAHKPGKPDEPSKVKVNFDFRLEDTSMEPGVCMNWPSKPGPPTWGLQFLQARNPALEVVGATEARSRRPGQSATLTVSALSYGAWARLKVVARTEGGGAVKVRFQGNEFDSIPLPLFEHNDRVARAWLVRHGLLGKPNDWDGETDPPSRKGPGDGLTLYEEYRGFSVNGKYVTGHPTKRDLFVADETGLESSGLDLFQRITSLVVHRMTKEELGDSRVVNRNFVAAPRVVSQHGVRIIRGTGSPEAVAVKDGGDPGPPGTCKYVKLPAPEAKPTAAATNVRRATVAHELGHAVGIFHHGDTDSSRLWFWKQKDDGAWQLYEDGLLGDSDTEEGKLMAAGHPVPIRAIREENGTPLKPADRLPPVYAWDDRLKGYKLHVFGRRSAAAGDDACVMANEDRQAWVSSRDPSLRYLPKPGESPVQDHLCDSPKGTGVNAVTHRPEPHYGDAAHGLGNCVEQIVVNDLYAPSN